jgi:hypothetical protein
VPKYDLAIAYRIYPKIANSALGLPFSHDKLQLSEICLRSFKKSLGDLRVKLWVLLDECPKEYEDLFRQSFAEEDLVLLPLAGVGNQATFVRQLELLLQQTKSELVYFAEDDYFYLPDQFPCMIDFLLAHRDVDFISPYDHLDDYTMDLHDDRKWVRAYGGKHWRTAASTCLTFLTRRETLCKTESVFRGYKRRSLDCSLWLSLTKRRVFDIRFFFDHLFQEPLSCKIVLKAWLYFWRQILFGKKWTLWVPLPGIATHLDVRAMAPAIDWAKMIEQEGNALNLRFTDSARP